MRLKNDTNDKTFIRYTYVHTVMYLQKYPFTLYVIYFIYLITAKVRITHANSHYYKHWSTYFKLECTEWLINYAEFI